MRDLRDVWADRREILHDGQYKAQFYNAGPKARGAHPQKISWAKNMQNLARFRTTSKYTNAFEFGPRDFPARENLPPPLNFH